MTEINNNMHNYEFAGIDKIKKNKEQDKQIDIKQGENPNKEYAADTGVLGRSQLRTRKGSDVSLSVNSAVKAAQCRPEILTIGDKLFDSMYDKYLKEGLDPSTAYINACCAQEELMAAAGL